MLFEDLTSKQWLEENAKLQQKKRELRKILAERKNLDYKRTELFTELFSEVGLELNCSEIETLPLDGTENQSTGRIVKLQFMLLDAETGFFETSVISGWLIDKGYNAGYKEYANALKNYLAVTFMIPANNDTEKETGSPKAKKEVEEK